MNRNTPAAIITRETWRVSTLYVITLAADRNAERRFTSAQDAADWLETYLPGATVEWRLK